MGILDSIVGQVLGGGNSQNLLINAIMSMIGGQSGGLDGLVKQFTSKGLGDIINSWIGTGKNLPITPQQVQQVLGNKSVADIAKKVGITSDDAASQLSKLLPQVVDKLTPSGKAPTGDIMAQGMDLLKGLMK
jgi:uncharacterized protein YidB (DUF937 family)